MSKQWEVIYQTPRFALFHNGNGGYLLSTKEDGDHECTNGFHLVNYVNAITDATRVDYPFVDIPDSDINFIKGLVDHVANGGNVDNYGSPKKMYHPITKAEGLNAIEKQRVTKRQESRDALKEVINCQAQKIYQDLKDNCQDFDDVWLGFEVNKDDAIELIAESLEELCRIRED